MSPAGQDDDGRRVLTELWEQFRPEFARRAALLGDVARALLHGPPPSDEQLEEASSAAHRLAGSLGTFGMPEASDLAREAEQLLGSLPLTPGEQERLVDLARRVAGEVEAR